VALPDIQLSPWALWIAAIVAALIAVPVMHLLSRRIDPHLFKRLNWSIVIGAVIFWMVLGLSLFALTWESFYAKFLPDPASRSLGRSLLELLPYPLIGWLMWWLAMRLPGNPAVNFCLLGGLQSLPEHLWGIYSLGMLDSVPFLHGTSPLSVIIFAIPEYMLYWSSVLWLALILYKNWQTRKVH
jgi:hypothetical protein